MSTKKSNKHLIRNSILLLVPAILLLSVAIYSGTRLISQKFYSISPRTEKVKSTVIKSETNQNKTIGWVKVQGTTIDLPIISNEKGDYPVEVEGYGWIDEALSSFHNNTAIMGHNIFNLSSQPATQSKEFKRFEELMDFVYYQFAQDNKYIQVTKDGEDKLYKIFMVGFVPKRDELFVLRENNYLQKIRDYSIYDYDVEVGEDDQLISLVTCTRFFGQHEEYSFYVVGRELRKNEKIENYSVKRNKNYEEIEKKLKAEGGVENEA